MTFVQIGKAPTEWETEIALRVISIWIGLPVEQAI